MASTLRNRAEEVKVEEAKVKVFLQKNIIPPPEHTALVFISSPRSRDSKSEEKDYAGEYISRNGQASKEDIIKSRGISLSRAAVVEEAWQSSRRTRPVVERGIRPVTRILNLP